MKRGRAETPGEAPPSSRTRHALKSEPPDALKQPEERRCPVCLEEWCNTFGGKCLNVCCGTEVCAECIENVEAAHDEEVDYHVYMAEAEHDPFAWGFFANVLYPLKCPICRGRLVMSNGSFLRQLNELVAKGSLPAMIELGVMLIHGYHEGVPRDSAAGQRMISKAAHLGSCDAMLKLHELYSYGLYGVAKNDKTGVQWLARAADRGNAAAQFKLGSHRMRVAANIADGKTLKAASTRRKRREAVAKETHAGLGLWELAAGQGMTAAMERLADHHKNEGDSKTALRYYELAANQGDLDSMCILGLAYEKGDTLGVREDLAKAKLWYQKANADPPGSHLARQGLRRIRDIEEARNPPPPVPKKPRAKKPAARAVPAYPAHRGLASATAGDAAVGRPAPALPPVRISRPGPHAQPRGAPPRRAPAQPRASPRPRPEETEGPYGGCAIA